MDHLTAGLDDAHVAVSDAVRASMPSRLQPETEVIPYCVRAGLAFLPYFPLANGLLTGKYRLGQPLPEGSRADAGFGPKVFTERNLQTVESLIEDALQLNMDSFTRHHITVVREYDPVPPVSVDKHKVLQILVNLLRNSKHAMDDSQPHEKRLTLKIRRQNDDTVAIIVTDTGVGIAPENLTRIFSHGFTTRKDGHGFGLHSAALAAQQMGGRLLANSDGPGRGATFIFELPLAAPVSPT